MQRCPVCNARLSAAPQCPRCSADLSRIVHSERMAKQWLSVALQTLQAGRADIASHAVLRSLSFKQTPQARLIKDFLIRHQYQALYRTVERQYWQAARDALATLVLLQGQNEATRRFYELIEYASAADELNP